MVDATIIVRLRNLASRLTPDQYISVDVETLQALLAAYPSVAAPVTPKKVCKYGDPFCPCQDGDPCHYEGKNPMPAPVIPQAKENL